MPSRYHGLLTDLQKAISARHRGEMEASRNFQLVGDEQLREFQEAIRRTIADREDTLTTLAETHARVRGETEEEFGAQLRGIETEHRGIVREIESRRGAERNDIEHRYNESTWVTSSVLDDTAEDSPKRQYERFKGTLLKTRDEQATEVEALDALSKEFAESRHWAGALPTEPTTVLKNRDAAAERFRELMDGAMGLLESARRMILPHLFLGFRSIATYFALSGLIFVPLFLLLDPTVLQVTTGRMSLHWIGISAGIGLGAGLLLTGIVYTLASMRFHDTMQSLTQTLAEAGWTHRRWLGFAQEEMGQAQKEFEFRQREMLKQREAAIKRYQQAHQQKVLEIEALLHEELTAARTDYAARRQEIETVRDERLKELDSQHREEVSHATAERTARLETLEAELEAYSADRRRRQAAAWHQMKTTWEQQLRDFQEAVQAADRESAEVYGEWQGTLDPAWTPAKTTPPFVRVGNYAIDLHNWQEAISSDMRLAPRASEFSLPATVRFPSETSLLLKGRGAKARESAVKVMQTAMLRLLTHLPPGKLRFTIIDPIGLGESFGGFMHLADYDELLVTSRIWTEPGHIEARLADLTEHMENVLQKYLRNEFATIEEYNEHAGEVAEPYHILVVSDFPSKFSDIAARRLISIVNSGPRCGVYTLMSVDTSKDIPHSFSLADIESACSTFEWKDEAFHSTSSELAPWPLQIDEPPPPDVFTGIVKRVGDASKDARRVEVSFQRIAPTPAAYWTSDSRRGIDVPLGRAGATKLQHLRLGQGTSQHMLVAGKTGSGKSTFLHALITNVALHYSADEVNFYLIDFKKGVEFKDYAQFELPHARVVAIESDREFGVSALQRLDEILQERGELFRKHGVQDIAGFRNANPNTPLPRILLVVDEFQEFFIEDDKLGQSASLLLDRLVRQGRAFGMHVILGSQTLGGAYSLARSTLGQVAVRVALQCSESDAHLILSEENTAARLLTRPGEAIYNDANGLLEGNHPFQIAWLSDEEREDYLLRIQGLAEHSDREWDPAIVFEGNIPSDAARNVAIRRLLEKRPEDRGLTAPTLWLGDAVEIKQPTAYTFHRQTGSHLLIVGADAEAAQGLMATGLLTLAAQVPPVGESTSPTFTVFDGSPADSPDAAMWKQVVDAAPGAVRRVTPRDSAAVLAELHAEWKDRDEHRDEVRPPLFLFVYHLSKFRDLRKGEDEFSLGGFGGSSEPKPPQPSKMFSDLLANGPESGIHVVIWCDLYSNLERWISRNAMRDLDTRVAFQMNQSDSSNLIDSPQAAKLGVHRALLYREESGTSEKFRPYGVPGGAWLQFVKARLAGEPEVEGEAAAVDLHEATDLDEFMIS
ncbi:FtsK/SpoIIIE domain-containing protein [Planctomyces sp. SH-PL14]|uniref:FtsK/SpoIIIE domain-containing protein n=1 Tax=Planctomyces sp. SH-PL14 TaxID=1632864 RepID=UPI00078E54BB|nr:FtsK/SpoIIIE domain-containing protein [Planctomyces sp. SH-PL14]AMV16542.1 DNA translocase FtsK [Planctomyces sp. SH-PL14]